MVAWWTRMQYLEVLCGAFVPPAGTEMAVAAWRCGLAMKT